MYRSLWKHRQKTTILRLCDRSCHGCDKAFLYHSLILCYCGISPKGQKTERTQNHEEKEPKRNQTACCRRNIYRFIRPVDAFGADSGCTALGSERNQYRICGTEHPISSVDRRAYAALYYYGLAWSGAAVHLHDFRRNRAFQLVKRKSLLRVDRDLLLLGLYYITVIFCYLLFEVVPINYRPIPIAGYMEASYPSSTTLLVLSVMPTVSFQVQGRMRKGTARMAVHVLVILFTVCMVAGRAASEAR